MGLEPTDGGITIRCVNHFATPTTGRGQENTFLDISVNSNSQASVGALRLLNRQ